MSSSACHLAGEGFDAGDGSPLDIFADEVVRRSAGWTCTIIGGVLERECNALFEVPSG